MAWTKDMFGVEKPIIALLHLRALPGDPLYAGDVEQVFRQAREDLIALQDGGVDGVLIANEFSLPYQPQAEPVTVGAMGYLVGRLKENIRVPFGVNVVLNPKALGLDHLKMFYKVNPESDAYLVPRDIKTITKSIIFHCAPDALCVSGASAGSETSTDIMSEVRSVAGDVPVFCNTGCNAKTAVEKLSHSDGACVGTTFKKDGKFENNVDPDRVVEFMNIVKEFRKTLV